MYTKPDWKCCDKYDETYKTIEMPKGFKHHSKLVCSHCNHFIKWLPSPEKQKKRDMVCNLCKELEKYKSNLNEYESLFISDMPKKKHYTEKQISFLTSLYYKVNTNNQI